MKNLIVLTLVLLTMNSLEAQVRILKRQSLYSFVGLTKRVVRPREIPYRGFESLSVKEDFSDLTSFLNLKSHHRIPNMETTFSFVNTRADVKKFFTADMGLCRGYSSLRRKMRHLAFFDPENINKIEIPNQENKKKYRKFYRNLIRKIRKYQPTIIPGFQNLRELSSHPLLIKMVTKEVLHEWGVKNFSRGTNTRALVRGVFKSSAYEELLLMRKKIEDFKNLNLNTMIWLSQKHSTWIHALEAIDVTPVQADGSFKVTFWNDKFLQPEKATSSITVNLDGSIHYDDGIEKRILNAAGVTQENDGEYLKMGENLKSFCQASPSICSIMSNH
jgi:hypothetical protein